MRCQYTKESKTCQLSGNTRYPNSVKAEVDSLNYLKVGSHDPILVQLSFKSFLCMMENAGVYTVQFSHPIIS